VCCLQGLGQFVLDLLGRDDGHGLVGFVSLCLAWWRRRKDQGGDLLEAWVGGCGWGGRPRREVKRLAQTETVRGHQHTCRSNKHNHPATTTQAFPKANPVHLNPVDSASSFLFILSAESVFPQRLRFAASTWRLEPGSGPLHAPFSRPTDLFMTRF